MAKLKPLKVKFIMENTDKIVTIELQLHHYVKIALDKISFWNDCRSKCFCIPINLNQLSHSELLRPKLTTHEQ